MPDQAQGGKQYFGRVIVVSYNCADFVNKVIECLRAQTEQDFEVVIVDNASTDVDAIAVPDDPRFTLMRLDRNLGFAAANNLGAAGARTPWIVTLNPDAFPQPDWLENLYRAARANPDVAMLGSTQLFADDPRMVDGLGDRYSVYGIAWRARHRYYADPPYYSGEVFSPCAAAAMYRRSDFEAVGGFDEDFFCYCEDVDLGFRIQLRGGRAIQVGDAIVHHVSGGVTRKYQAFALYHGVRNLVWTMVKNVPLPMLVLTSFGHVAALGYLFGCRWRGEQTKTALRGLRDAWRGLGPMLAKRRDIQRMRRSSLADLARIITWDPLKMKARV